MSTCNDDDEGRPKNAPRLGEFFVIDQDFDVPPHEVVFVNGRDLRPPGHPFIRPESGGFPVLEAKPLLRETSADHHLGDFQVGFEGYWLVSERLKRVFEAIDVDAFEFVQCDLIEFDGSVGDPYYLCDLIRVLDAVDDDASEVKILTEGFPDGKFYKLAGGARLAFKKDVIGAAHVFGSPFNTHLNVCDRIMRDALIEHGIGTVEIGSGMMLIDAADY